MIRELKSNTRVHIISLDYVMIGQKNITITKVSENPFTTNYQSQLAWRTQLELYMEEMLGPIKQVLDEETREQI